MKKIAVIPLAVTVLGVALLFTAHNRPVAADATNAAKDIVGVWEVDADAPYRPHLFTFHDDGTMTSTNPTNVQENPSDPHGGTNDSLGMGVWKVEMDHGSSYVVGTFEELNAFADNHQPTDTLSVSFKVQLTDSDEGFDGPAVAKLGNLTAPSHLTGTRLHIDQSAVDSL